MRSESVEEAINRREFLRRIGVVGVGALAGPGLLSACARGVDGTAEGDADPDGGTTDATPDATGGVLRIGQGVPNTSVDPVTFFDPYAIAVAQPSLEYLCFAEPDGSLRPVLATGWETDDDGLTWRFAIREGVVFHDGTPLTAEQVAATFLHLTDPDVQTAAQSAFDGVLDHEGIEQTGEFQVTFTLLRRFADFPYLASSTNYNTLIVPTGYEGDFEDNPNGTGPFLLVDYAAGQRASYEPFGDYWQDDLPLLDGIEIRMFEDFQAQMIAAQGGELDCTVDLTDRAAGNALVGGGGWRIETALGSSMIAVNLRTDVAPFDDVRVRQAIALAIDREALLDTVFQGDGVLGNDHLFAPVFAISPTTEVDQRSRDLEAAGTLLEEAGLGDGFPMTITLDEAGRELAVTMADQLAAVGIDVSLDVLSSEAFYAAGDDSPWLNAPATAVGWAARAVPSQFLIPMIRSDGIWNSAKYNNPDVDELITALDETVDAAERTTTAEAIAETLRDEVPVVISVWQSSSRLVREGVDAFPPDPSFFIDVTRTSIRS